MQIDEKDKFFHDTDEDSHIINLIQLEEAARIDAEVKKINDPVDDGGDGVKDLLSAE